MKEMLYKIYERKEEYDISHRALFKSSKKILCNFKIFISSFRLPLSRSQKNKCDPTKSKKQ